jgi:hypothetical protein
MDIKENGLVNPEYNWYYRAKIAAVINQLNSRQRIDILVDVGSGSGFFGIEVSKACKVKTKMFIDPGYLADPPGNLPSAEVFPSCPHASGDVYLFIDVMEHVDDDFQLLSHYVNEANSDATFVISVPAFTFLWSNHDVFLEHKRRYNRRQLEAVVLRTGLVIEESRYLFSSIFPLVYLIRLLKRGLGDKNIDSDMRDYSRLVNLGLKWLCVFEHKYLVNRRFGTSVLLTARKKAD